MNEQMILALAVAVPFLGAFILPLIGRVSERARNAAALAMALAPLAAAALLAPGAAAGRAVTIAVQGFTLLHADALAVFMAAVSSLLGAVIVLYSFGYIRRYPCRNEYYCMALLFLGSMSGLVFSRHLLVLYVFWEVTAVACWRLIGFFREKEHWLRADKAFLVTVFGALLMLLGFIMIYNETGSFDLARIRAALNGRPVSGLATALILCGLFSKSATLPLHTWLPDAGVAPTPVTALLHAAVLVKIGLYAYARIFIAGVEIAPAWHTVIPAVAAASALTAAGAALVETDIKRLIAYSTISQIGFIFLGLAVGNETAVAGGLLYILMHGIAKGGLFLCAGIVEQNTHLRDITRMGGLAAVMPVTAAAFLLCAFSVMGIPPFGCFFSKYMVIAGALRGGQGAIALAFLAGAALTIVYLFRLFTLVFLGTPRATISPAPAEGSATMVFSAATFGALSLLSGLLIYFPSHFVQDVVRLMPGVLR